ncbi:MAG: histidine phosphatase family protein [Gammaproteobacteria bacterium]|nr:histidine phosphatase family protein [Gammaproteobacteria bacterium]
MNRLLVIMRHAKSDWASGALADYDRPLNRRGQRDAPRMARWLCANRFRPQEIISSPAVRASETTRSVIRELELDEAAVRWDPRVYEADLDDLLAVLADHQAAVPVQMLVGHNPGLERLAGYLARAETLPREGKLLPTAGVMVLEIPTGRSGIAREAGACVAHMRPRWLEGGD